MKKFSDLEITQEKIEVLLKKVVKKMDIKAEVEKVQNTDDQVNFKFKIDNKPCMIQANKKGNGKFTLHSTSNNRDISNGICVTIVKLINKGLEVKDIENEPNPDEIEDIDPLKKIIPSVINLCPEKLVLFCRVALELDKPINTRYYDFATLIICIRGFIECLFIDYGFKRRSLESYFLSQDEKIYIRPIIVSKINSEITTSSIVKLYSISQGLIDHLKLDKDTSTEIKTHDIVDNRRIKYNEAFILMEQIAQSINMDAEFKI